MLSLKQHIRDVPDFPRPGILFRDITPLLREHMGATVEQLSGLLDTGEWESVDAIAGIEARGFVLAAALACRHSKGFVPIRKRGKLPPPVISAAYELEYGEAALEMHHGEGRLLIVDDVLATGGTMTASAELAQQAGYDVAFLAALIDLQLVKEFSCNGNGVRSVVKY